MTAVYVTSLKDRRRHCAAELSPSETNRPDIILNLTAFSARSDSGGSVLDQANAPVLQLPLSGGSHRQWTDSQRGLGPADLAMNVVLPELDGRIIAGAISFKGETRRYAALEFTRLVHQPDSAGVSYAADLALSLGSARRHAARGATPRLHPIRLSGESRAHRLCRRPRHAAQCRRDRQTARAGGVRGRASRSTKLA